MIDECHAPNTCSALPRKMLPCVPTCPRKGERRQFMMIQYNSQPSVCRRPPLLANIEIQKSDLYPRPHLLLVLGIPVSHQSICANLNQFGLQSSLFSHASPSVKRPVTQPLHLFELGQLKKGMCWYPMSRNLGRVVMLLANPTFSRHLCTQGGGGVVQLTNESCSYPQIDQAQCCGPGRLPIARRRNRPPCRGG